MAWKERTKDTGCERPKHIKERVVDEVTMDKQLVNDKTGKIGALNLAHGSDSTYDDDDDISNSLYTKFYILHTI